eukprot:COSAG01_NODE_1260_length_11008_cov_96.487208_16_plen_73_part_00
MQIPVDQPAEILDAAFWTEKIHACRHGDALRLRTAEPPLPLQTGPAGDRPSLPATPLPLQKGLPATPLPLHY